ncbi:glucokinase regulator family protein [Aspergillus sclerotialis]|uniref:N-acetyl-D-glucosamine kinase n=1 Tax=Aspergillus sclerotialis TaxID=2070753 RepID=A0A3A2ZHI1_9EURO|nr:glucokinase regulator family protein [Aspergillus sclerotialis]
MDLDNLSRLQTEAVNPRTVQIDQMSTLEMCTAINNDDHMVARSVSPHLALIADAIDALAPRVRKGGRVIYVGAGTSGRLGILDASEIPPTFAAPHGQFLGLIAGGDAAIRRAQEGAEDSIQAGEDDMADLKLDPGIDAIIGIAASGRTPYVLGCLAFAKRWGCLTIGVACAKPSAMSYSGDVDFLITPLPGPEVVTGSTRLKAGTATKMVLNMLSTGTMIRIGKTYGNMMVDLVASNLKLKQRSRNILRRLSKICESMSDADLDSLLLNCNGRVKLALLVSETGLSVNECQEKLDLAGGVLSKALSTEPANEQLKGPPVHDRNFVLCIDGGGTKCAAVVADSTGTLSRGIAGPCNLTDGNDIDAIIRTIVTATQNALKGLLTGRNQPDVSDEHLRCFKTAWIGLAGLDRFGFREKLVPKLTEVFGLTVEGGLRLTNDVDLLAASMARHPVTTSAIVAIAGTGSVAMRYTRDVEEYVRVARSGGWGHVLGDEGSGYAIGLQAVKHTLTSLEEKRLGLCREPLGILEKKILYHFGPTDPSDGDLDLLARLLVQHPTQSIKSRIAGVAEIVLNSVEEDKAAAAIVDSQASALIEKTLGRLVNPNCVGYTRPEESGLILSGSVMSNSTYKTLVLSRLENQGIQFQYVETVDDAVLTGARYLVSTPRPQ